MKIKHAYRNFKEWFSDRWIMPDEFKSVEADKNFRNIHVILHLIFFFGLISLIICRICHNENLPDYKLKLHYYTFYMLFSFVLLIMVTIIDKCRNAGHRIKNLPFYILFFLMIGMSLFTTFVFESIINGILIFVLTTVLSVVFFNCDPQIFLIVSIFFGIVTTPAVFHGYGMETTRDYYILLCLLYCMAMFKRRITKRDLIKSQLLEKHKEVLESEVSRTTMEVSEQHQKIVELQNHTIISLSNLVENRDSDTGEHVRRTSAYVKAIAVSAMNSGLYKETITPEYIELLEKAAPMHDIGKIVVPDSVLKKPGKLTDEEFEQIKKHTTEGGRIVKEVLGENEDQKYVTIACEVATSHHERWNGSGYPYGLKKENIPLSARIMALADVFDALVSPRCYKEPFPFDKAMEIIKDGAGTHFDPDLANLFVSIQDDILAIFEKYKD